MKYGEGNMKDYTNHQDSGDTKLFGGCTINKDSLLVEAYGTVDELNSHIGLARAQGDDEELNEILHDVQQDLFVIGSDLANPHRSADTQTHVVLLTADHVKKMEDLIVRLNNELEPLKHFILPTGTPAAALLHICRAVCRRAERRIVTLYTQEKINQEILTYFNRLSDLLFYLARIANKRAGVQDETWEAER